MIRDILDLLASEEWMIEDEDVQTAKGLYEYPLTFKELRTSIKRKKLANGK